VTELFWRLLPGVRVRERSRFLFFAGLLALVATAQSMGQAGSEALFLAEFGTAHLGSTLIAASLSTVLISMVYAARVGGVRNDTLFIRWLLGASGLLGLGTAVALAGQVLVYPALFCFWFVGQAVFLNHFWTFSGDYFDTLGSKRLFPIFVIGASVGGAFGAGLGWVLNALFGPIALIAGWAAILAAAAGLLRLARRPLRRWGPLELEEADDSSVEGLKGAVSYLRASSIGRWLVLSALGMVLAAFLAFRLHSVALYFLLSNLL
jgi:hypothetical protein